MSITNSNKELSKTHIDCGGSFKVKLSLTAEPDIMTNPTDIVLILDRSGSMEGKPLESLKVGAKKFIDIIDEATDGTHEGQIGMGSRIGIVSFSNTAVQDTQLITDVSELKTAVDNLRIGRNTNHGDAFTKAIEMFDLNSTNKKVMVMFTDGVTTAGSPPAPIANEAKAQGIIIYVIGLSGNGGIDENALNQWASQPPEAYVAITPNDEELQDLFEDLAQNISKPGAKNIVVTDKLNPCFRVTYVYKPTKGTAEKLDDYTVQWKIDELGVKHSEGAVLEFNVEHIGTCSGTLEVNEDVIYTDDIRSVVTFPSPTIDVDCGTEVCPEHCPEAVDIQVNGCEDVVEIDAGDVKMDSLGFIINLKVVLKNVCPDRRVALAAILTETDAKDTEHRRGVKVFTVPAHSGSGCRDVKVNCIRFVVTGDTDVSGSSASFCHTRNFKARFIANYIDSGFDCCDSTMQCQ